MSSRTPLTAASQDDAGQVRTGPGRRLADASLTRHLTAAVLAAVVLALLSGQLGQYRQYQLAEVAAWVTAVAGLTILVGLSGQISVGHGAFMAVGAYATALLLTHFGWPIELVYLAVAGISAVAGAVFGVAAARLRGPYLAGATLMLAVALPFFAVAYPGVFGGDQGLFVTVTTPGFLGAAFPLTRWLAWLTCGFALIALVLLANLARSRVGRSWRALRDDEVAAALAGLNVARMQVLAFVVSSAAAGLGGALLATWASGANPDTFSLTLSIGLLTAAVLGGLGSLAGAVWGSLVLVLVPSYLTNLGASHGLSSGASASVPIAIYGVVLIVVMLVFPAGIQGAIRRLLGAGYKGPTAPAAAAPLSVFRRPGPARNPQEEDST
jgi:branched-chain amino acid transport system permease protein